MNEKNQTPRLYIRGHKLPCTRKSGRDPQVGMGDGEEDEGELEEFDDNHLESDVTALGYTTPASEQGEHTTDCVDA